ncbi:MULTISPECIES: hypothetical protein [Chloroflexus]|jgi:hypothetical protein|uniref:hypothetical protein n=1 Tax=Chloroflexus TaxID=1107 RepID=UPI000173C501|nr:MULTISPECIES: hypothetical protein [Chloroflexus]RMG46728.1 MAG: hypothetical protein D6716_17235 [Chloroflexota bacterium]GIV95335.1 MAG: hypothetical protein KatS3mg056_4044 [Chloroflexus sp.]
MAVNVVGRMPPAAHSGPRVVVLHPAQPAVAARHRAHAPHLVAVQIPRPLIAAPHADDIGAKPIAVRRCAAHGMLPAGDGDDHSLPVRLLLRMTDPPDIKRPSFANRTGLAEFVPSTGLFP